LYKKKKNGEAICTPTRRISDYHEEEKKRKKERRFARRGKVSYHGKGKERMKAGRPSGTSLAQRVAEGADHAQAVEEKEGPIDPPVKKKKRGGGEKKEIQLGSKLCRIDARSLPGMMGVAANLGRGKKKEKMHPRLRPPASCRKRKKIPWRAR